MTTPLSPETLVPRLGEHLVQNGRITDEDLQKALAYQKQKQAEGEPCLLGEALIESETAKPQSDRARRDGADHPTAECARRC